MACFNHKSKSSCSIKPAWQNQTAMAIMVGYRIQETLNNFGYHFWMLLSKSRTIFYEGGKVVGFHKTKLLVECSANKNITRMLVFGMGSPGNGRFINGGFS
jgi:hypothetical protein